MAQMHDVNCPQCGAALESGFIGYFSGIMWHERAIVEWRRLIPFVFGAAKFIIGGIVSTPWIRSHEAWRCPARGTLVVPT
jgi:hypothetical protein